MERHYRIFKLSPFNGQMSLKDVGQMDPHIFRYQDERGNFRTYEEASSWLRGLSSLQGEYIIIEVFFKK